MSQFFHTHDWEPLVAEKATELCACGISVGEAIEPDVGLAELDLLSLTEIW